MSSFQSATTRQGLHRRNMNSESPQSEFIQRLRRSPPSESSSSTPSSSSSSSTTTTSNTSGKKKKAAPKVDAAWNEYANMLFIDQPTGTGYSYGPKPNYVHELDVSSANLVNLLARFFKIFPEYQQMDLYICGESFAAQAILDTNIISAPLKGIMIGNGWIDPINQYLTYPEFAFKVGLVNPSSKAADLVNEELKKCTEWIDSNSTTPSAITDSTVQTVNSQKMCLNMYDVRLVDSYPAYGLTWPPDLADITPYLSRTDVKQALHAQDHAADWVECEAKVGNNFWAKTSQPSVTLFPKLLDKIKILLFSGVYWNDIDTLLINV
ncbi:Cell death protease [Puccinia graminis f. sp. tritici]|uniref:Pheromone-processing carboxypeptidase KEX1 n=1 Tax=Puccinia graminis f. sp. tritici TaxID=56615 RepID=A0A5B0RPF6_PUCGR|nr:Cell death protease [Puccinia graminis f. sp. tritici]